MTTVRCSRLPLVAQCAASVVAPQMSFADGGPDADLGTAVHEAMAHHINGRSVDFDDLAERYRVDADELSFLVWRGKEAWRQVEHEFPNPVTEESIKAVFPPGAFSDDLLVITGHPDVYAITDDGKARVLDFKSGRSDESAEDQVLGYSIGIMDEYQSVQEVWVGVARLRDEIIDGVTWTRDQVMRRWQKMGDHIRRGAYHPGRWCGHCPRNHECDHAKTMVVRYIDVLRHANGELTTAGVAALYDARKVLSPLLDAANDMIHAEVEKAGGTLPLGDGRELVLEQCQKTAIDFGAGADVLRAVLGDKLPEVITVSKTKVEAIVKANAGPRQKKAAVNDLLEKLSEVGALSSHPYQRLEARRGSASNAAIEDSASADVSGAG